MSLFGGPRKSNSLFAGSLMQCYNLSGACSCEIKTNDKKSFLEQFQRACKKHKVAHIKKMLQENPHFDLETPTSQGETPLFFATQDPATTQLLLDLKANPNAKNCFGQTPLFGRHNPAVVQILLDAKADATTVDDRKENALFRTDTPGCIDLLLKAGANPNQVNRGNSSILAMSWLDKYFDKVKLLIDAGAETREMVKIVDHRFDWMKATAHCREYALQRLEEARQEEMQLARECLTDIPKAIIENIVNNFF